MVSRRCIISVQDTAGRLGLYYTSVSLGEINFLSAISDVEMADLKKNLLIAGFEILSDKKSVLVEKIKVVVLKMIHSEEGLPETNISYFISSALNHDYTYLANVFSEVTGSTIERFIIRHKIERVKELIQDGELNLTDISYKMNYSSVAHLSAQFKKITGLTPTAFRNQENKARINLEDL